MVTFQAVSSQGVHSDDGKRGATIYEIAGSPHVFRVRAEKYPENNQAASGWFGGRVLFGHDKRSLTEALKIASAWVNEGKLPEGVT